MIFFVLSFLVMSSSVWAMKQEKHDTLTMIAQPIVTGAVAGVIEGSTGVPCMNIKNSLQQGKRWGSVMKNSRYWYNGFGVNSAAMGPATALQLGINQVLEDVVPGDGRAVSTLRSFSAGALSAIACGPTELMIVHKQGAEKKSALQTFKKLTERRGISVMSRGIVPKGLREGGFTVGFLSLFPFIREYVENHGVENKLGSLCVAAATAGPLTAVATHPFDTVSTLMQVDYKKDQYKNMYDVFKDVYGTKGMRGLFSGVAPRCVRIALAIPLMDRVKYYMFTELFSDK